MTPTTSSSIEIGRTVRPRRIVEVGAALGLLPEEIEPYGPYKAKVRLSVLERLRDRPDGREVLVTAITPTPLGEGKTTTTIGLVQGLARLGVRAAAAIRQPSLGPVFGIKGGGAGGGYSQLVPMEEVNLHLTGDIHAVAAAHNLGAAFLDNHLARGNAMGIDPRTISWPRVVDVNDRVLRRTLLGLRAGAGVVPREGEWHITAASEVMAILALAADLQDLRRRLGRVVVAERYDRRPVTLEELKVAGAMTVVMREAIKPNLVQTLEGSPAFVHAGPFANIAHGNSSVIADRVARKLVDVVCTEAGFGADMGAEKFFDIKCRLSGIRPAAAVLVSTVRALKMHAGAGRTATGRSGDPPLEREDPDAVRAGAENLAKQIENVRIFGVPCVVAINAFPGDHPSEWEQIRAVALDAGARDAVVSTHFREGGAGAEELARATWAAVEEATSDFEPLYPDELPLAEKIELIARRIYGADGIDLSPEAQSELEDIERLGYGTLPICMAKTALSLSHDPELKGRPRGFRVPIRQARVFAGAGFVTAYCGDMQTMPGLPATPAGETIDIDADGEIVGLF